MKVTYVMRSVTDWCGNYEDRTNKTYVTFGNTRTDEEMNTWLTLMQYTHNNGYGCCKMIIYYQFASDDSIIHYTEHMKRDILRSLFCILVKHLIYI